MAVILSAVLGNNLASLHNSKHLLKLVTVGLGSIFEPTRLFPYDNYWENLHTMSIPYNLKGGNDSELLGDC